MLVRVKILNNFTRNTNTMARAHNHEIINRIFGSSLCNLSSGFHHKRSHRFLSDNSCDYVV